MRHHAIEAPRRTREMVPSRVLTTVSVKYLFGDVNIAQNFYFFRKAKKNESYSDIAGHIGGTLFPKFVFLAAAALYLYLDHEQLPFFCPTCPSLSPFKSPSHAVTKARLTKTKMAAERRSAMSAETAQSPTFMKNISSRPGSISPSVTPFSGTLMELDEYRQKPLFCLPFLLCSGAA